MSEACAVPKCTEGVTARGVCGRHLSEAAAHKRKGKSWSEALALVVVPPKANDRGEPVSSAESNAPVPRWAEDVATSLAPLMTRDEAAGVLKVSRKTLDRRIRAGLLKVTRHGRRILVARLAVLELLGGGSA